MPTNIRRMQAIIEIIVNHLFVIVTQSDDGNGKLGRGRGIKVVIKAIIDPKKE